MKIQFKNSVAVLAMAIALVSCNNDDSSETISGKGNLDVEFDNVFAGADLILDTQSNTTSQSENLKISKVKYIISNVVLTKEDGTTYVYPKSDSYFIVDEANEATHVLDLTGVPAGNYTKIKFGIGVDQAQYNLGEANQGNLLTNAESNGMISNWANGYNYLSFEGVFTSGTVSSNTAFMVKTGKTAVNYNYTEVTLNMPDKALVRTNITPEIHIMADVAKIIDGTNKMKFSEEANVADETKIGLITANLQEMFSVNHVHND